MRHLRLILLPTLVLMLPAPSLAQAPDHEVTRRWTHANWLEELGFTAVNAVLGGVVGGVTTLLTDEASFAEGFVDDRVVDSGPVQDNWSLTLGDALSVSGRRVPPRIRLPAELVDGIELPADLRLRSARLFAWDDDAYGAYPVQVMRSTTVRLTVTHTGSDP